MSKRTPLSAVSVAITLRSASTLTSLTFTFWLPRRLTFNTTLYLTRLFHWSFVFSTACVLSAETTTKRVTV